MSTSHVYRIRPPDKEGIPRINTLLPENKQVPWRQIDRILRGEEAESEIEPIHLTVRGSRWKNWHYYAEGNYGLFSKSLVELIEPHMKQCFQIGLNALVNGAPFYFLRGIGTIDCLDRAHSELVMFPHDPQRLMGIRRHRFFKDQIPDPSVFLIREKLTGVFATDSIKAMVEKAQLGGVFLEDAEQRNYY